jgi:hypothetical protein
MDLENNVILELGNVLTQVAQYVNHFVCIVHFHLTNKYETITNVVILADPENRKGFYLSLEQDISNKDVTPKPFVRNESVIMDHLMTIIEILPVTYIHILTIENKLSCRYYSSVDNSLDGVLKVIKGYPGEE